LQRAKQLDRTNVIVIETDLHQGIPSYETWWDVPIAEVSGLEAVREARKHYDQEKAKERIFL
jgi:3D-(3,5/4)-trihydroxycyclohexane-1,2-dione acylhydrolase (decyclizing)